MPTGNEERGKEADSRSLVEPGTPNDEAEVRHSDSPVYLCVSGDVDRRMKELGTSVLLALMAVTMALPPSPHYVPSWLAIPIMALGALHFGRRAIDETPRVLVDKEGVTDRTSIFGGTLSLRWNEIRAVTPARWRNAVDLEVVDLSAIRSQVSLGRSLEIRTNRIFGLKRLSIDVTLLGMKKRELASRIEEGLLEAEREALGLPARPHVLPEGIESS